MRLSFCPTCRIYVEYCEHYNESHDLEQVQAVITKQDLEQVQAVITKQGLDSVYLTTSEVTERCNECNQFMIDDACCFNHRVRRAEILGMGSEFVDELKKRGA